MTRLCIMQQVSVLKGTLQSARRNRKKRKNASIVFQLWKHSEVTSRNAICRTNVCDSDRGLTGNLRRLATPWRAHFHISCAGDERRDKASKNTSTPLQTAGSARISPSQAIMSHRPRPKSCMMETSHNAVQRLVQYWRAGLTRGSDGKLTRSDNSSTRSQILLLYAAALHPPSSSPAGSALKFTLQPE